VRFRVDTSKLFVLLVVLADAAAAAAAAADAAADGTAMERIISLKVAALWLWTAWNGSSPSEVDPSTFGGASSDDRVVFTCLEIGHELG
jgi:hypothetical protein